MITLYKFYSDSCLPCKTMNKSLFTALNSIDTDILPNIDIIEVDVELDTTLAVEYKVRSIPTLVITNHDEHHSMVGNYSVLEIKKFITSNFNRLKRIS